MRISTVTSPYIRVSYRLTLDEYDRCTIDEQYKALPIYLGNLTAIHFDANRFQIECVSIDNPADTEIAHTVEALDAVDGPLGAEQFSSVRVEREGREQVVPGVCR